jgi:hypothetical protein
LAVRRAVTESSHSADVELQYGTVEAFAGLCPVKLSGSFLRKLLMVDEAHHMRRGLETFTQTLIIRIDFKKPWH